MSMENGLPVVKLISCKAEVMLIIPDSSEEDLILLVLLCIGVLTTSLTNTLKLMLKRVLQVVHLLMISIPTESIGMRNKSTHIWMMIQTKFYKLITQLKAIGKNQVFQIEAILGNTLLTKMLLSIDLTILFSILQLEELLGISRTELLLSHGLILHKELHLSSMIIRDNGGLPGEIIAVSKSTGLKFGT